MTTVVAISDTHGFESGLSLPDGDILLHGGDICRHGTLEDLAGFAAWLAGCPHPCKIVIAGNHDRVFTGEARHRAIELLARAGAVYLEDDSTRAFGLTIHGSPWTSVFMDWAFMLPLEERRRKWSRIAAHTDILLTHSPPAGVMDRVGGRPLGCPALLEHVRRIRPKLHVFGHIHEFHGILRRGGTAFVNASTCSERFQPERPPLALRL